MNKNRSLFIALGSHLVTARKRSLGQGNIFTPVCHSVHRGGMRGFIRGVCMVFLGGGVSGFIWEGMRGFIWGGRVWFFRIQ